MNEYQIFLCIYKYLEENFDGTRSEEYLNYLSSITPAPWADGGCADPSFYESFIYIIKALFRKNECSLEEGLNYAKAYLKEFNRFEHEKLQSNIDESEKIFAECTLNDWTRIFDSLT